MQLSIIHAIQALHHPFLDWLFINLTRLGEETFILILLTTLYWTVDKDVARKVAFAFFVSLMANAALKTFLQIPRPIGAPDVRSLRIETATGFSFPSGHTQAAAVLFTSLALHFKSVWIKRAAPILMILVALSRVYLGVHWPTDVLGGLALGVLIAYLGHSIESRTAWILSTAVFIPVVFLLSDPELAKAWGLMAGALLGTLWETTTIHFSTNAPLGRRILRILAGLALLLALRIGLKAVLPETLWADSLRYLLIGLFGMGGMPWLMRRGIL